jgi:hypothetical protein
MNKIQDFIGLTSYNQAYNYYVEYSDDERNELINEYNKFNYPIPNSIKNKVPIDIDINDIEYKELVDKYKSINQNDLLNNNEPKKSFYKILLNKLNLQKIILNTDEDIINFILTNTSININIKVTNNNLNFKDRSDLFEKDTYINNISIIFNNLDKINNLDFSNCKLNTQIIIKLFENKIINNIAIINFSDNPTFGGYEYIFNSIIKPNIDSIIELNFSNCNLSNIKNLFDIKLTKLIRLNMSFNNFTENDYNYINNNININNIEALNFSDCNINNNKLIKLFYNLNLKNLQYCNLNNNTLIKDNDNNNYTGMKVLVKSLLENTTLEYMYLIGSFNTDQEKENLFRLFKCAKIYPKKELFLEPDNNIKNKVLLGKYNTNCDNFERFQNSNNNINIIILYIFFSIILFYFIYRINKN